MARRVDKEGGDKSPVHDAREGEIPAGTIYDKPVSSLDIFATSVAASSAMLPKQVEGKNLVLMSRVNKMEHHIQRCTGGKVT